MMMQILEAGGLGVLTDGIRQPDPDNPRGYYEFEPVKKTRQDDSWLDGAAGKAVKMVYKLLYDLPRDRRYRAILMQRDLGEVLASQGKMLGWLGNQDESVTDEEMAGLFRRELDRFAASIAEQGNFAVLCVEYQDVIRDPRHEGERIDSSLGGTLDTGAMATVVDPSLYRNRAYPEAHAGPGARQ